MPLTIAEAKEQTQPVWNDSRYEMSVILTSIITYFFLLGAFFYVFFLLVAMQVGRVIGSQHSYHL